VPLSHENYVAQVIYHLWERTVVIYCSSVNIATILSRAGKLMYGSLLSKNLPS